MDHYTVLSNIRLSGELGGVVQVVQATIVVALLQLIKKEQHSCMERGKLLEHIFLGGRHIPEVKRVSVAIFTDGIG
jgi:hypothetical protein